jgi:adenosylcobyric acid synthase
MLVLTTADGRRPDGAVSADGRIAGCYVHGLFANDTFRHAFLKALRPERRAGPPWQATIERTLDTFADHLEAHLDLDALLAVAQSR